MQSLTPIAGRSAPVSLSPARNLIIVAATLAISVLGGLWLVPQYGINGLLFTLLAVAAVIGAAAGLLVPLLGVLLLTLIVPLENVVVLGERGSSITLVRVVGLGVFGLWMVRKLVTRESWAGVLSARIVAPAALFVVFGMASLLWSEHFASAFQDAFTTIQLFAFMVLVIDVVDSREKVDWVVRVLVLGGLIALGMTLSQAVVSDMKRAGFMVSGGVNQTAIYLVVLTPLAFYLLRTPAKGLLWRIIGLSFIVLTPWTVIVTFSRTSLVMIFPAFLSQLWQMLKGKGGSRFGLLLIVILVGAILALTVDWGRVTERASTIGPALQGATDEDDEAMSSRIQHWIGAVEIFRDHPVIGAGYGNFGYQFLDYQFSVPDRYVKRFFTTLRSPHSTFLGILSELGIVGTGLWLWLLGVALFSAARTWAVAKSDDGAAGVLAQALFFSILVYAAFSIFAVVHLHKLLWLLLGLCEAIRVLGVRGQGTECNQRAEP